MGLINKVDMVCLSPVGYGTISHRRQTYHINLVDQTHVQRTRPRRKTVFFKTSLQVFTLIMSSFMRVDGSFCMFLELSKDEIQILALA